MSSPRHFAQHVRVSSTDELSYASSAKGEINDTIQTIVTGRKCWKTMKGKGEVVWPPFLEAALVEGLEKYQPVESRTTRAFGRFPMRNKFISDYIFQTTGKRRTPKQVGSRLQQLRDTAEGKRILQVLSSRHIAMMQPKSHPSAHAQASSSSSSNTTTPGAPNPPSAPPRQHITIAVALDNSSSYSPASLSPLLTTPSTSSSSPAHSPLSAHPGHGLSTLSTTGSHTAPADPAASPRPLRAIDPTLTFRSPATLHAYSAFRVLLRGQPAPVHTERTGFALRTSSVLPGATWPAAMECTFLYSTQLVPRFWTHLCDCADPTQYTIVQDIVRADGPGAGSPSEDAHAPEDVILTVVYNFSVASGNGHGNGNGHGHGHGTGAGAMGSPPLSPTGSSHSGAFSAESSPELGSDYDLSGMMYSSLTTHSRPSTSGGSGVHAHAHSHAGPSPHLSPGGTSSAPNSAPAGGAGPTYAHGALPLPTDVSRSAGHGSHAGSTHSVGSAGTPGLIHRDEEGYASSLPPSPLESTFAHSVHEGALPPLPPIGVGIGPGVGMGAAGMGAGLGVGVGGMGLGLGMGVGAMGALGVGAMGGGGLGALGGAQGMCGPGAAGNGYVGGYGGPAVYEGAGMGHHGHYAFDAASY